MSGIKHRRGAVGSRKDDCLCIIRAPSVLKIVAISCYLLASEVSAFCGVLSPSSFLRAHHHYHRRDVCYSRSDRHRSPLQPYEQACCYSKKNRTRRPILLQAALSSDPACLSSAYAEAVANAASDGKCLTIYEERWYGRFHELKEYKRVYGDCNVPRGWKENPGLARWVNKQRYHYMLFTTARRGPKKRQKSCITPERIRALESIGFEWVLNTEWKQRYDELKQYKAKYGDCNVPLGWKENPQLANWVVKQRYQYMLFANNDPNKKQKSHITPERIIALESIGFEWVLIAEWKLRYGELKEYKAKYGHCNVPQHWKENPQLANWVSTQRQQYKLFMSEDSEGNEKSRITPERIIALESIGFEWVLVLLTEWKQRYDELKQYKAKYGDCNVPRGWKENPQLANWVVKQRQQYKGKKSKMTEERIQMLESIGFSWDAHEDVWRQQRYDELKQYKAKYGDCNVPRGWKENPQLANWVSTQRQQYKGKKSKMTEERIQMLESIGFSWDAHEDVWRQRFNELKMYMVRYGDCNVPYRWKENPQLGVWVKTQRAQYRLYQEGKRSLLTKERIRALRSINFRWRVKRGRPVEKRNVR